MNRLFVTLVFVGIWLSRAVFGAPVELSAVQPNTSTWECEPTDSTMGSSNWYAGVSRSPGLNGSYWRTEGTLTSLSISEAPEDNIVTLNVYGNDLTDSISIEVDPWTSAGSSDVVASLSLPDGTYVINAQYPRNLSVTFRTYNDLGENGTYGATLPKLSAFTKSFVTWPSQVGRRWLYVVVLDNASFYLAFYKYDGTLAYVGEVDATTFSHGYLYRHQIDPAVGFAVIEKKPREGGQPGGYVYNPSVLPYGTGVDNTTGAPNIFTAEPAAF